LGHVFEAEGGRVRLLYQDAVVGEGSLEECERILLSRLEEAYGEGQPNLPFPTFGGLQLWADVFWRAGWRIQEHIGTGHHRLLDAKSVRRAWGTLAECRTAFESHRVHHGFPEPRGHVVVVLHGLGRSGGGFGKLQTALEDAGFDVAIPVYPSTRRSLTEHADQIRGLLAQLEGVQGVSFVTHSLGGLVVRELLSVSDAPWQQHIEAGRILMLAPPNQGSALADSLKDFLPFEALAGPAGQEVVSAGSGSQLPVPPWPFAIMAGGKGNKKGWNPLVAGDDDGIVAVEEARLEGAAGFVVVQRSHTFIMAAPEVCLATVAWLRDGVPPK